ncbi:MAG: response regulator [Proteobacteria bacterium]|nr:response regulator [Pseudomonadota bacterium]
MGSNSKKITVLLADDHAMIRAGIRRLLDDTADVEVVAEVDTGELAYREYFQHQPDVSIMDLTMPGIGGLEAIRRIRQKDGNARILVLSVHEDVIFPTRVIQAGGMGYLSKRTAPEALIRAVRSVARGEVFLERDIAQKIALHGINGEEDPIKELSEREFEVFRMLAEGKTVNEVAEALFLSPKTVGTYQTRIMQKLKVSNIAGLTRLAIRKGLIEP